VSEPGSLGPKGRATLGLVLIVLGVVLALGRAGILEITGLARWWPLLVIGIGLVKVGQPIEDGQRAVGVALLSVGGVFQALAILSMVMWWPLVFMGVGTLLVWNGIQRPVGDRPPPPHSPYVSELALVGFVKRIHHAPEIRGGYITAAMGVVDLDLRKTRIGTSPAYLDVVAFWGGIVLKVPEGWTVDAQVTPILGGFENKALPPLAGNGPAPRLVVRGHAVMGAVGIEN
jgi:hypothetical protein